MYEMQRVFQGSVAQWKSRVLIILWSWVQTPAEPPNLLITFNINAALVELADTLDLGSSG